MNGEAVPATSLPSECVIPSAAALQAERGIWRGSSCGRRALRRPLPHPIQFRARNPMNRRHFLLMSSAAFASMLTARQAVAFTRATTENAESSSMPLLFGADYYPDQTPENLWEQDAAAMA